MIKMLLQAANPCLIHQIVHENKHKTAVVSRYQTQLIYAEHNRWSLGPIALHPVQWNVKWIILLFLPQTQSWCHPQMLNVIKARVLFWLMSHQISLTDEITLSRCNTHFVLQLSNQFLQNWNTLWNFQNDLLY